MNDPTQVPHGERHAEGAVASPSETPTPTGKGWWAGLSSEWRNIFIGVVILISLPVLAACSIGLENLWTSVFHGVSWAVFVRGFALLLVTVLLSLLWFLILGRFTVKDAYKDALTKVDELIKSNVLALLKVAAQDIPESTRKVIGDRLDPTNEGSPLHPIFKPGGHVPSAVAAAQTHLEKASDILASFKLNLEADRSLTSKIADDHDGFRRWGDKWIGTATDVLNWLKAEYYKKHGLLMEPGDYAQFLKDVEEEHFHQNGQGKTHAEEVRLCGTMVGFSFLLPNALRNHACESLSGFKRIKIIASDVGDLFWYPVYLAAKTAQMIWSCEEVLRRAITDGHMDLLIEIRYVDHDLLAAVLDVPHASMAVLQSLDAEGFVEILNKLGSDEKERRYQLGFRFDNRPAPTDEYSRYSRAFDNIWQKYADRSEVWGLKKFPDGEYLRIWSSRWEWNDRSDSSGLGGAMPDVFAANAKKVNQAALADGDGNRSWDALRQITDARLVSTIASAEIASFLEKITQAAAAKAPGMPRIISTITANPLLGTLLRSDCPCGKNHE